ncbi:MAG: putative sugar O-methyltransferase [Candidatus Omnitrophica bacterium]|nr:putative sugar O-methyltransferase [Candidatus Omnitrophota bacterium]
MNDYIEYIVTRILAVLKRNSENENPGEMWNWIKSQSAEVEINAKSLEDMANNKLIFGFFGITITPDDREALLKLAEAVGVRGLQNPEGAVNAKPIVNIDLDEPWCHTSELMRRIQNEMKISFPMPIFQGNKNEGLHTHFGLITARHCYYLLLLKRIIDTFPDRNTRIIEIGAGLGLLGYFLDRVGYKDYTIIDLARVNACQAYFLARNLPEREIVFSGDKDPFDKIYKDCLKVLHVSDFEKVPKGRFDLMVNMDSLTEMSKDEAVNYMKSDCAELFLSVNHEQNSFRVIDIHKPYRKLVYRFPFWARPGYVEELYRKL